MLKITVSNMNSRTTFVLSGRLAGPWVEELRDCWLKHQIDAPAACHLDLREVTFIDEAGIALLSQLYREGVTIDAAGCLTKAIVQNFSDARAPIQDGLAQ